MCIRDRAYSTPERPVTLDHDDSFFTDSWNVTGKWNGRETIEYMSQKNWMATEGIPLLCISRPSGDTVEVQFKNRNHFYITSNPVMDQLFADMTGRNWTFLPDREPPPGPPDAVLSVYRKEGMDVFISCYQKEETAVIWTAPFVYNIDVYKRQAVRRIFHPVPVRIHQSHLCLPSQV